MKENLEEDMIKDHKEEAIGTTTEDQEQMFQGEVEGAVDLMNIVIMNK